MKIAQMVLIQRSLNQGDNIMQKLSCPQLNQVREDFNNRVEKKSILGKSKKIIWTYKRRYGKIQ